MSYPSYPPNPYQPPNSPYQPYPPYSPPPDGDPAIAVFVVLNFIWGGLSLLWAGLFIVIICFGIFASGDTGAELAAGIAGSLMLGSPGFIGCVLYPLAGWGLMQRRRWGYYLHLVGAVLAGFSCLGMIYTILAFVLCTQPRFYYSFFPVQPQQWPR